MVGSFGSVEFDDGSTTVFHSIFTYSGSATYTFGSRLAIVAWFVSSGVGFLPDLKGRGIRLVPPVNSVPTAGRPWRSCGPNRTSRPAFYSVRIRWGSRREVGRTVPRSADGVVTL